MFKQVTATLTCVTVLVLVANAEDPTWAHTNDPAPPTGHTNDPGQSTAQAPTQKPGDATGNGKVDFEDVFEILLGWGRCPDCAGDLNDDGAIDIGDLMLVLQNWE